MDALRTYGFFGLAALSGIAWLVVSAGDQAAYALIPALLAAVFVCAGVVQQSARWGILATSTLEFACAWYLFQRKLDSSGASACSIDTTFDCDKVNLSAYSEVAGVPITLVGAGVAAGLILATLMAPRGDNDKGHLAQLAAIVGAASVAYSLFLAWASTQLGAFCVVCITMYLGNAVLLWAGLKGLSAHGRTMFQDLGGLFGSRDVTTMLITFAVLFAVGWNAFSGTQAGPEIPRVTGGGGGAAASSAVFASMYGAPCREPELSGDEPIEGDPNAPIMIVEWADYGCPHCAHAYGELKELVHARPDVQVRYRYFALTGECNPSLDKIEGDEAGPLRCAAAQAAECARRQGKFWEMSGQLFNNQGYFQPDQLTFMAKEVGLDVDAWQACVDSQTGRDVIEAAGKAGGDVCVRGTPAMFVKGLVDGQWVELKAATRDILKLLEAKDDGILLPPPTPGM